jgi:hypothetical protein
MPVPSLITDLSTTPASNSPAGSENVFPSLDDYLRAQSAFLASVRDNSGNGWVSPYLPLAGGTMTGTVNGLQMASANGGQLAGLRNKIINGDMRVAQRGTVSSGISTVTYTLDRWIVFTGGASLSVGQSTGDGALFQYALNVVGAVGNTTCNITQRIERRNAYPLASKQVTISARIYASASFTPTWSVDSANTADTFAATTNVATGTFSALSIGWNDVTFTTTLNSACQNGFQVSFLMGATTTGNKGLTGVQLEVGPIPTIFEQIPIGLSLQLCQRYYYRTTTTSGRTGSGYCASTTTADIFIQFPVSMRIAPTALEQSGTASEYGVAFGAGGANQSAVPSFIAGGASVNGADYLATVASGFTTGQGCIGYLNGGYLGWSAEL